MEGFLSQCPFRGTCSQSFNRMAVASPALPLAVAEFIACRTGYSKEYVTSLRQYLNMFARQWPQAHVGQITIDHLETWFGVRNEPPESMNANLGRMAAFFKWCIRRGYTFSDPTELIERPRIVPRVPTTFTAAQVRYIFNFFQQAKDWPMILWCSLAFFIGARPVEIHRLQRDAIDLTAKRVFISPEISKTKRGRFSPIPDNAVKWIKLASDVDIPCEITVRRHKARLGIEWPQDAARHTAATFLLAANLNASKTALALGNSERILLRRYAVPVNEKDCLDYWNIRPRQAQCELWAA